MNYICLYYKSLKRIYSTTILFCYYTKKYNIRFATQMIFSILFHNSKYKHKAILNYLFENYNFIINKYKDMKQDSTFISQDSPIWVCWFQGEKNMPEIIKICISSITRNSGNHKVIFIDNSNLHQYVSIPQYIIDKVKKNEITLTHFSDILRCQLLALHGGIWLDATILLTKEININKMSFFTLKRKDINNLYVTQSRWTGFCMGGAPNNVLHSFMIDFFYEYHKKETKLIDYFLVDYIIALAYYNIPTCKKMIDSVPYTNENLYYVQNNLFEPINKSEFDCVLEDTSIFKLTYKYDRKNNNSNTLYYYLLDHFTKN